MRWNVWSRRGSAEMYAAALAIVAVRSAVLAIGDVGFGRRDISLRTCLSAGALRGRPMAGELGGDQPRDGVDGGDGDGACVGAVGALR